MCTGKLLFFVMVAPLATATAIATAAAMMTTAWQQQQQHKSWQKRTKPTVDNSYNFLRKRQPGGPLGTTSNGSLGIMFSSQNSIMSSIDSLVDDETIYIELQ